MEAQQRLHKVVKERLKKTVKGKGRLLQRAATELCGGRLCEGGKGTVARLDAEVGEHVDRSLANCNGG